MDRQTQEKDDVSSLIDSNPLVNYFDYQDIQLEITIQTIIRKWALLVNINHFVNPPNKK
jgi:hypothetical protein